MAPIFKARYAGRIEKARETLAQIQSQRQKFDQESAELITKTRRNLAQKIRQLRHRVRHRGILVAEQRSEKSLARQLLKLEVQYKQSLRHAQTECLNLSLRVAEEVIGLTLPELSASLSSRISAALNELRDSRPVVIEVNPGDREEVARELSLRRRPMRHEVRGAEGLERGKARIVTNIGSLRIDWREHLEQLKSDLREAQKKERASVGNS